jgi:hypothetical protein
MEKKSLKKNSLNGSKAKICRKDYILLTSRNKKQVPMGAVESESNLLVIQRRV